MSTPFSASVDIGDVLKKLQKEVADHEARATAAKQQLVALQSTYRDLEHLVAQAQAELAELRAECDYVRRAKEESAWFNKNWESFRDGLNRMSEALDAV